MVNILMLALQEGRQYGHMGLLDLLGGHPPGPDCRGRHEVDEAGFVAGVLEGDLLDGLLYWAEDQC